MSRYWIEFSPNYGNNFMSGGVSKWKVYGLMLVLLVFGTVTTIVAKVQSLLKSDGKSFHHPYFQAGSTFLGKMICGIVFLFGEHFNKKPENPLIFTQPEPKKSGLKARLGPFIFAILGFVESIGSILGMIGLSLTPASVYQMLSGLIVAVVAVYSIIFRKRKLFKHQTVGVISLLVGVFIVGFGSIIYGDTNSRNPGLGAILIIISQLIYGGEMVLEEKFFDDIYVPALEAVGIEGIGGLIFFIILLPILYFIPCYDLDICSGSGHVEDSLYAFKQLGASSLFLFLFFALIFSISFYAWSGIAVTKNASALSRTTIDTSRPLTVWGIFLVAGWEQFIWMQLIGFALLAFGIFVYNEVIIVPWFGLKEAVFAHQEVEKKRIRLLSEKDVVAKSQDSNEEELLSNR